MAFCFKRRESVAKAIRRLGCDRIESALECLKDLGRVDAIHCARKDIKKTRAVLRVVRASIEKNDFRRLTKLLRDAARQLAAPRDACVKENTLKALTAHFKGQLKAEALRQVRSDLHRIAEEEMQRFSEEKMVRKIKRVLSRTAKEIECLDINGKGWNAIGSGVMAAYSEGRRACEMALHDSSPEIFHDWRKRAKDLWYQVSLLHPIWPEQMDALARELETLGEYLGDDHDLFVLHQFVRERCAQDTDLRELEILYALIGQRQRELRVAAIALGKRFYADKPSAFCDRLASYWHTWRREKRSSARSMEAAP